MHRARMHGQGESQGDLPLKVWDGAGKGQKCIRNAGDRLHWI